MVQIRSELKVADNSGGKVAMLIGIPGFSHRKFARIGDLIVISVRDAIPHANVARHTVQRGVVVRTRKETRRKDGSYIRFDDNAVVLLDGKTKNPKGTRIFGPVARELKERGYDKIISLSPEVL
ncbi:50S ribosomal protein L14 [Candidatus Dojkabacteria bacterium]|jgi:large subunit ribosomal protein L14|nr:50S ribosomal protein L14 [Candidatus Dojkabacteria bacterium]